ncbi:hypothetical protein LPB86_03395 [Pedobacter sp. MC2016-14]|uniref:hypothetical protein n=1 Tax=Pedobacter sp. MC2016-14 TaxID=2897327 RepID=UPI001E44251B|nr:hypothetical protein [Pedobacter sp. MC2016-14]MCD0487257.1 hypothetical protein [Pedobacter sp. MC2016-14]
MQQPFDITIGSVDYAVFPEGNEIYTIFKDGKEYIQIQKDTDLQWLKLDAETALPLFETDEEVAKIGAQILAYVPEEDDEEESYDGELDQDDELDG